MNTTLDVKKMVLEDAVNDYADTVSNLYKAFELHKRIAAALLEEHGGGRLSISDEIMFKSGTEDFDILSWYDYEDQRKHFQVTWKE